MERDRMEWRQKTDIEQLFSKGSSIFYCIISTFVFLKMHVKFHLE